MQIFLPTRFLTGFQNGQYRECLNEILTCKEYIRRYGEHTQVGKNLKHRMGYAERRLKMLNRLKGGVNVSK